MQSLLQPLGAGGYLHAANDAGDVEWAGFGGVEADFVDGGGAGFEVGDGVMGLAFQGQAGERGEFASETEVGEQVGAVRGDFEVEQHIGLDQLAEWGADVGGVGVEDEQARMVVAKAEFAPAAHHAEGGDAAQFAFFDLEAAREFGTGKRDGDFIADFEILGAADNLTQCALTDIDLADREFFGVGMLNGFRDLANDDEVGVDALLLNAFDFDAREGEQIGELGDGEVGEIDVGGEPG